MTAPSLPVPAPELQPPSDATLIERSLAEPEVFAVLFDRYAADIHHYAARRLGASAADDLVAETFLAAFRRRSGYDTGRSQARPWLYGIAATLIARQRRSEQRLYRALARTGLDPLPEPIADQVVRRVAAQGQQRHLAAALAGLSGAEREVLLLLAWVACPMRRSPRPWGCRWAPCGHGCTAPAARSARYWVTPSRPGRPRRHEWRS